ncbi:MAG: hypothetical protein JOY62_04200 [Acidobacteriaceae bacterium]|nr:hypothetical protein [Acidobacteriaceae bacterium]MBV9779155.1 hypothetical protein [Acidobacteriaceae bacterium]
MKLVNLIFASICVIGLTQLGWSQSHRNRDARHGVLGYFDPETGTFKPMTPQALEEGAAPPASPTTGTFVFNITITIKSSIPTSDTIVCTATADTDDVSSGRFMDEEASVAAKRTGNTATCSVTIPYSWPLSSASSDTVGLSYEVEAFSSTTTGALTRLSTQSLPSIKVPANGATTTETIASTI